ncbi:MAG: hypothetical protein AB9888_15345 [Bacteroidales bacterium]
MSELFIKFQRCSIYKLFNSFTPASRAVILFAIPFTIVDAVHYYTAGGALVFSLPLLLVSYLLCGVLASKFARQDEQELSEWPGVGRSAGLRLWLTSTVINTLLAIFLGFVSLGATLLTGVVYLCLFAPIHLLGSVLVGQLGGWLYQQIVQRTSAF